MLAQHLCKLASWRGEVTETLREHSPGPRVCASACPSSSSSSSRSPPTVARMRLGCTDSADFLSDGCKTRANLEIVDKVWGENYSRLLFFYVGISLRIVKFYCRRVVKAAVCDRLTIKLTIVLPA